MIDKQLQEIADKLSYIKDYINQLQEINHNMFTIRKSLEQLIDNIDN